MRRRDFLASGALIPGLGTAGCLGGGSDVADQFDQSDGEFGPDADDGRDADGESSDGHRRDPVDVQDAFVTRWKTDNVGVSRDDQIRLPLLEDGTYDIVVWWGDGTSDVVESHLTTAAWHTYDEPGEYVVTIEGTLQGWSFVDSLAFGQTGDASKLLEIREWGGFDVGIGESQVDYGVTLPTPRTDFAMARNLIVTADDVPSIEGGTSLAFLFTLTDLSEASALPEWDVSSVDDMSGTFSGASSFDRDLSEWDVSSVETMWSMFSGASSFDGDLSGWDVSNVRDMRRMFVHAESFDGDVSQWDVSSVEDMGMLFWGASSFDGDVSRWDVSKVETMRGMFRLASSFDGDVSNWDVSGVEDMGMLFWGASSFDSDVSDWDVSNVVNTSRMFADAGSFDGDVSGWDVSSVEDMAATFVRAESFDGMVEEWDVSNVEDMSQLFRNATSFDGDVSAWDVSSVVDMSQLFHDASSFDGDVSDWDVSRVEDMSWMFHDASSFDGDVSSWDVSRVEDMSRLFEGTAFSRESYDVLLLAWQHLSLQRGVVFSAGDAQYSTGEPAAARQYLLDEFGWEITDGGVAE